MLRMGLTALLLIGAGSAANASDRILFSITYDSGGHLYVADRYHGHYPHRHHFYHHWKERVYHGRHHWDGRWDSGPPRFIHYHHRYHLPHRHLHRHGRRCH